MEEEEKRRGQEFALIPLADEREREREDGYEPRPTLTWPCLYLTRQQPLSNERDEEE